MYIRIIKDGAILSKIGQQRKIQLNQMDRVGVLHTVKYLADMPCDRLCTAGVPALEVRH